MLIVGLLIILFIIRLFNGAFKYYDYYIMLRL
jgi:hypothetical protein